MALAVCGGAMLQCSFGMAPSSLMVLPQNKVTNVMGLANIMVNKPYGQHQPFGMCSPWQTQPWLPPQRQPWECLRLCRIPVIPGPWAPGSPTCLIGGQPALNNSCKLTLRLWGNDPNHQSRANHHSNSMKIRGYSTMGKKRWLFLLFLWIVSSVAGCWFLHRYVANYTYHHPFLIGRDEDYVVVGVTIMMNRPIY